MIFYCVRSNNISAPNKYAKRLGKTDVQKPSGEAIQYLKFARFGRFFFTESRFRTALFIRRLFRECRHSRAV